jgi:hypothetical protein
VYAGVRIDQDALRGESLGAVASDCITVIKMAMFNCVELDVPVAVEARGNEAILATERHFTPTQLAALWGMSPSKVRELFSEGEGLESLRAGKVRSWSVRITRCGYHSQSPLEFTIRSLPLRNDPRNVCHVQIAHPGSVVSPDHLGIGVA